MAVIPVTSGLQLLLDARTITGLSDGAALSVTWSDQSGQNNHASQGTAANRPIYKTNIFGSNPAVRHVDSTDFVSGSFASWGTMSGMTTLVCGSNFPASQTGSGRMFCMAASGITDTMGFLFGQTPNQAMWTGGSDRFPLGIPLTSVGASQPIILGGSMSSSQLDQIVNGVVRGNHSHGTSLPSAPSVYATGYINAGVPTAGFSCLWDCHFIVVFNRKLTGSEIEQVCSWMRTELGMQPAASSGGLISPRGQNGGYSA